MKSMKIALVLLALVLITSCIVGGTFAKYTSSQGAEDTADVAAWSFKFDTSETDEVDIATTDITFNLFNTIKTTGSVDNENAVVTDMLAPGTEGSMEISIKNDSDVVADWTVVYTVNYAATAVPLEFTLTPDDADSWTTDIDDLNDEGRFAVGDAAKTFTVYWRWSFTPTVDGKTDVTDTALGIAAYAGTQVAPIVTCTVTATQVDYVVANNPG